MEQKKFEVGNGNYQAIMVARDFVDSWIGEDGEIVHISIRSRENQYKVAVGIVVGGEIFKIRLFFCLTGKTPRKLAGEVTSKGLAPVMKQIVSQAA